mgnify:CR=1 FL=1
MLIGIVINLVVIYRTELNNIYFPNNIECYRFPLEYIYLLELKDTYWTNNIKHTFNRMFNKSNFQFSSNLINPTIDEIKNGSCWFNLALSRIPFIKIQKGRCTKTENQTVYSIQIAWKYKWNNLLCALSSRIKGPVCLKHYWTSNFCIEVIQIYQGRNIRNRPDEWLGLLLGLSLQN